MSICKYNDKMDQQANVIMYWLRRFDPDPQWYIWSLHIITFVSFPVFIISMVCILRVNIASNPAYKYLLAVNFRSYLTQFSLSAGTIPILTLPGAGGYPVGILALLGAPSCFQCAVVLSLGIANGLTTTMLFFYRSHMTLPFSRFAYNMTVVLFVICGVIVPLIMNTFLCHAMDTNKTKLAFKKKCPDIFALLPDHVKNYSLLIVEIIPPVQTVFYYFGFLLVVAIVVIIFFNYRATVTLRRQIFSQATLSMHNALVRCLLIQTAVYYILFTFPVAFILLITGFQQNLPAAANLAFIILSLSDPAGVLALILGHKKYRRVVLNPFKTEKTVVRSVIQR